MLFIFNELNYIELTLITKLFPEYRDAQEPNCHQDGNGDYWLNLDYTAPYPGGKFLQDSIVTIINL